MPRARIWGWGENPELARENSEKYASKRWKKETKECQISVSGRDRDEGTGFDISAYAREPNNVGVLAERLLDLALKENNKVYFVTIELYDHKASNKEQYRGNLHDVEEAYRRREQLLLKKFSDDPEVKAITQGKKTIVVFPATSVFCELESDYANKITVEITDDYFPRIMNFLSPLVESLVKEGLAKNVVGYELLEDIEGLEVESAEQEDDEVCVYLSYPAHATK